MAMPRKPVTLTGNSPFAPLHLEGAVFGLQLQLFALAFRLALKLADSHQPLQ